MVMKTARVAAPEEEINRQAEPLQIAEVVIVPEVEVKMKAEAQPAGAIKLVKQAIPATIAQMKMKEAEEAVGTLMVGIRVAERIARAMQGAEVLMMKVMPGEVTTPAAIVREQIVGEIQVVTI